MNDPHGTTLRSMPGLLNGRVIRQAPYDPLDEEALAVVGRVAGR
jgi:hypothetical protein